MRRQMLLFDALHRADGPVPLAQLARAAGLPKTSTHRLAEELCRHDLLEKTRDGYRLGMRLFELGASVPRQRALREAALPLMADLGEATRCTVHLAVLDGADALYVQILNREGGNRLPSRLAGRVPAHATGVGKAILAFSHPDVVAAVVATGMPRLTPRTICTPGGLLRELEGVRADGVAYDREESTVGIHCVAAPVLAGDRPVAAVSVTTRSHQQAVQAAPAARTVGLALGRVL